MPMRLAKYKIHHIIYYANLLAQLCNLKRTLAKDPAQEEHRLQVYFRSRKKQEETHKVGEACITEGVFGVRIIRMEGKKSHPWLTTALAQAV